MIKAIKSVVDFVDWMLIWLSPWFIVFIFIVIIKSLQTAEMSSFNRTFLEVFAAVLTAYLFIRAKMLAIDILVKRSKKNVVSK